ncbi:MAG TPA: hypothetical protein VN893_02450 [Bryobacteraceae bacterium]|nr:hypothetical protein [Bryobacteraceae bacterium]
MASLLTEALVRLLFQLVGRSFRERSDLLSHHFAQLLPGLRAELLQIVGADPIAAPGNAISAHAPAAEVAPDAVLLDAAEESAHVRGGVGDLQRALDDLLLRCRSADGRVSEIEAQSVLIPRVEGLPKLMTHAGRRCHVLCGGAT